MFSRWLRSIFSQTRAQQRSAKLNLLCLEDRVTPASAFALSGSNLLSFDTASPTIVQSTAITGVAGSETLVGIDFRPQNGVLYGLGVDAGNDTATLYTISARTGSVSPVGTPSGITFTTDGVTVVDLPDPATIGYGIDFNPAADRLRVVAGSLNFRVNPNTGAPVDGDTVTGGTNPDGAINNGTTTVDATAYTNNQPNNGGITTQYTLDAASDSLFIQNPPNNGNQTLGQTVTLASAPLDFTAINGFDIPSGVNASASNAAVGSGSGFAVLNVGGTTGLYNINLVDAAATFVGNVSDGITAVQGLAIQNDLGGFPAVALNAAGDILVRFNSSTPGTTTSQALATGSLVAGEVLVGIDFRPATGQLYGLAIDPVAETGSLYIIDPQTGAITIAVTGTQSQISFVGVDFPDPASSGYGFDFNPDVDRIRVVTHTGLNFRINPNTGQEVDGDSGTGGSQTDGDINGLPGGSTGVSAAAYTNSFGNDTTVTATTLYTLDATSDMLFIQNPPNNGTQSDGLAITLNSIPLDFTDINGFDISAGVSVSTSNSAAPTASRGFAVLTVGGVTGMFSIDLTTGAATNLGSVGAGTTVLAGLTLADAPAGSVAFASATVSAFEDAGTATINLTRTGGTNGALTVTVNVTGGTALTGSDFADGPYTVTFADGASAASFDILLVDDAIFEGNKTVVLTIVAVDNAGIIGTPNISTLTITEEDAQQSFNITDAQGYALDSDGTALIPFSTANPAAALAPITLTGVTVGEVLVSIDYRPQNGVLYGLGVNVSANTATLYALSPRSGTATAVGTVGGIAFTTDGATVVDLPDPTVVGYGMDFNPAVDRLRVVAGSLNFRVNPNTGAPVDGNNGGSTAPGTNPDGNINGPTTSVQETAYTNNFPNNGGVTTQYTLDATTDTLYIQNAPNSGTQTLGIAVTLNNAALDFTAVNGFDILANINAPASNLAPPVGSGFAILTVAGIDSLYRIDLTTGAASAVSVIGSTVEMLSGLALQSDLSLVPGIGLSDDGSQLLRFNDPAGIFRVPIAGIASGETLVGIDFRPATGQLYGLGVNAVSDTATLYLIDPQGGNLTAIGVVGSIAFTTDGVTVVELPDPTVVGYGIDFNPAADRLRVVTGDGLNFRVNPNTGSSVDGDNTGLTTGTVTGTNPDGAINGATSVTATAYTNSFGGATATTQYTLDSGTDMLFIQNPPNTGSQGAGVAVTLNGSPLDFSEINGFDILNGVSTTVSGVPVSNGFGYAVLTVAGTANLFRIDLTTGVTTLVSQVGDGSDLRGLTLAQTPAGTVSFTVTTISVAEGAGTAVVSLTRASGTNGPLTVTVNVVGGTATAGSDFTTGPYTATFADGATTATFSVPITDDSINLEGNETITLLIGDVSNQGVIGALNAATLTITENDLTSPPVNVFGVGPSIIIAKSDNTTTTVTPYSDFGGSVTTALGDITGDNIADVITGAGANGHVKVFDGKTGAEIRSFFAYEGFTGGVDVGAGDVNGDGIADIITGASVNGHVKVFDGVTGAEIFSFFAYADYAGAVNVAGGDINGDGHADIITGASVNGHVKAFNGATGAEIRSFFAYAGYTGGVDVAAGDVNVDGFADIITGSNDNAHVKAFDGVTNAEIRSFFAFPGFSGAARVAARDTTLDGAAEIIVGTGPGTTARIRTFDGITLALLSETPLTDPSNLGVFVA